jgi:hypothetical protein
MPVLSEVEGSKGSLVLVFPPHIYYLISASNSFRSS